MEFQRATSPRSRPWALTLIMAGGTGGHIFPGLAVAEQMRGARLGRGLDGRARRHGERLVPRPAIALHRIRASGCAARACAEAARRRSILLDSFWQARAIIRRLQPDVVLGLGGYVDLSRRHDGLAASGRSTLHEQNAIAGLANACWRRGRRVCEAFPTLLALKGSRVDRQPGAHRDSVDRTAAKPLSPAAGPLRCWSWAAAWARRR